MIKCILFDLGGVVFNYSDMHDYVPYLSKISGVGIGEVAKIFSSKELDLLQMGRISQARFTSFIAKRLSIREDRVMFVRYRNLKGKLNLEVVRTARKVSRYYIVGYLTNESRGRYAGVRKALKPFDSIFRYRFSSCYLGLSKPSEKIYRRVLNATGFKPQEVVFIDNNRENVIGARRVGIKSILFTSSKDLDRKLRRIGVKV